MMTGGSVLDDLCEAATLDDPRGAAILDDLRDTLGRELTRDDLRQLEILAAFEGFDVREYLEGDRYSFIDPYAPRCPTWRPRRKRTRYGLRHRADCMTASLAGRKDNGFDRCLGCVMAGRRARAAKLPQRRCPVCHRTFVMTPNGRRTCSEACRYALSSTVRRAAGRSSRLCRRGHIKTRRRRDGSRECVVCKTIGNRRRRESRRAAHPGRAPGADLVTLGVLSDQWTRRGVLLAALPKVVKRKALGNRLQRLEARGLAERRRIGSNWFEWRRTRAEAS